MPDPAASRLRRGVALARLALRTDIKEGLAQGSAVIALGHLARLTLGLASSALLARALGPDGLSAFAVISAAMLIGALMADLGLSNSVVRQIAADAPARPDRAQRTAGVFARLKLLGVLAVAALLMVLANPVARLLNLPDVIDGIPAATLMRVAALGIVATNLSGITRSLLHALRRFRGMTGTQIVNIALTFMLTAALFLAGRLTMLPALLIGVVAALAAALAGWWWLPAGWRVNVRNAVFTKNGVSLRGSESRELLGFSKWLWLAGIFYTLAAQLDLLLLNQWAAPVVVGYYALSLNLYTKADLLNDTLRTVLLPGASSLAGRAALAAYVRRSVTRSLLLALPVLLAFPLARPFITLVYGPAYAPAVPIFYLLLLLLLFDLFAAPLILLVYPLNLPRFIAAADGARVLALLVVGILLIPAWGVYGAVLARLAATVAGALVSGLAIASRLRQNARPADQFEH